MEEDKIRFFHKDIYDSDPYVGKDIRRLQELAYGMPGFDDALSDVLLTPDNFMDFYNNGRRYTDNGAVAVFTGKQFVFFKNDKDGQQGHIFTYARIHNAMTGNFDEIIRLGEAARISARQDKHYLSLTFEAENKLTYKDIRVYYNGPISREEYASFMDFYDQFGDIIKTLGFGLWVNDRSKNEGDNDPPIYDIDSLRSFLESNIDENKVPYVAPEGERIIGFPNSYTVRKKL